MVATKNGFTSISTKYVIAALKGFRNPCTPLRQHLVYKIQYTAVTLHCGLKLSISCFNISNTFGSIYTYYYCDPSTQSDIYHDTI